MTNYYCRDAFAWGTRPQFFSNTFPFHERLARSISLSETTLRPSESWVKICVCQRFYLSSHNYRNRVRRFGRRCPSMMLRNSQGPALAAHSRKCALDCPEAGAGPFDIPQDNGATSPSGSVGEGGEFQRILCDLRCQKVSLLYGVCSMRPHFAVSELRTLAHKKTKHKRNK